MHEINIDEQIKNFDARDKAILKEELTSILTLHSNVSTRGKVKTIDNSTSFSIFLESSFSYEELVKNIKYIPSKLSFDTYKYLIESGFDLEIILSSFILGEVKQSTENMPFFNIIKEKFISILRSFTWDRLKQAEDDILILNIIKEKILSDKQDVDDLLSSVLEDFVPIHDFKTEEHWEIDLTDNIKQLLNMMSELGADFSSAFTKILEKNFIYRVSPHILKYLVEEHSLNPNLLLEHAIINNLLDLAKYSLEHNANVNAKTLDNEETLLERALSKYNDIPMLELLMSNSNTDIKLDYFLPIILTNDIHSSALLVSKLARSYVNEEIYEFTRAHGASHSLIQMFVDHFYIIKDYADAMDGKPSSLNKEELELLRPDSIIDITKYKNISLPNRYGYHPLHLASLARKHELIHEMIKEGFDIYALDSHGITALQFICDMLNYSINKEELELAKTLSNNIEEVDIVLNNGESLADFLLSNEELAPQALARTNGPLFYFLKEDADLFLPEKNPNQVNIAISHGEGFWSTGAWAGARMLAKNFGNVTFYLVKNEDVEAGGERFLKQFDAFINPGASDSFPRKVEEFTKQDLPSNDSLEQHYQNILEKSLGLKIPYLGMCAGAQHLSLYHNGTLAPIKGYNKGQHEITFIEGTLPYFLTLSNSEQKNLLQECIMPKVSFKGDTAHHFVAVADKIGNALQLGGISEDGLAMAYAHNSGIRYATQFHPEHHYNLDANQQNYEKQWLDNFILTAHIHHNYRVNNGTHPIEYFTTIQERLEECIKQPTCIDEEYTMPSLGEVSLTNFGD